MVKKKPTEVPQRKDMEGCNLPFCQYEKLWFVQITLDFTRVFQNAQLHFCKKVVEKIEENLKVQILENSKHETKVRRPYTNLVRVFSECVSVKCCTGSWGLIPAYCLSLTLHDCTRVTINPSGSFYLKWKNTFTAACLYFCWLLSVLLTLDFLLHRYKNRADNAIQDCKAEFSKCYHMNACHPFCLARLYCTSRDPHGGIIHDVPSVVTTHSTCREPSIWYLQKYPRLTPLKAY